MCVIENLKVKLTTDIRFLLVKSLKWVVNDHLLAVF